MKSCSKIVIFLAFLLVSTQSPAEKYALIIGGQSQGIQTTHHEFARQTIAVSKGLSSKGYEVTTLFGGSTQPSSQAHKERSKYITDYEYINQLKPQTATPQHISNYFHQLVKKVNRGDQIEIYISAHGNDTCGKEGYYIHNDSDIGSNCSHTIMLFDENGNSIEYPSSQLFDYLKQLEDKGAMPTIVFNSCHSGRLKSKLKQVGLQNTCSYFQTAGNELGYGCFEDDPDFSKDFTSTAEYISLRYYQHTLDSLSNDPYFSNQNCFNKVKQHFKEKHMSLDTINSSYWSSRRFDETFQSPSTSDQLNIDYFSNGILFSPLSQRQPLFCCQANFAVDKLLHQINEFKGLTINTARQPIKRAISSYNNWAKQLKNAIKEGKPIEQILSLQENMDTAAKLVTQEERKLVDGLFNIPIKTSGNCERPL